MVHALSRGILIADFNELSVGMILDYIDVYDKLHDRKENEEEHMRLATQINFNHF